MTPEVDDQCVSDKALGVKSKIADMLSAASTAKCVQEALDHVMNGGPVNTQEVNTEDTLIHDERHDLLLDPILGRESVLPDYKRIPLIEDLLWHAWKFDCKYDLDIDGFPLYQSCDCNIFNPACILCRVCEVQEYHHHVKVTGDYGCYAIGELPEVTCLTGANTVIIGDVNDTPESPSALQVQICSQPSSFMKTRSHKFSKRRLRLPVQQTFHKTIFSRKKRFYYACELPENPLQDPFTMEDINSVLDNMPPLFGPEQADKLAELTKEYIANVERLSHPDSVVDAVQCALQCAVTQYAPAYDDSDSDDGYDEVAERIRRLRKPTFVPNSGRMPPGGRDGLSAETDHGWLFDLYFNISWTFFTTVAIILSLADPLLALQAFGKWVTAFTATMSRSIRAYMLLAFATSKLQQAQQAAQDARSEIERWAHIVVKLKPEEFTDTDKKLFMELKTAAHLLYHIMHGNKTAAIEWGSNYIVTRPELAIPLATIPYDLVKQAFNGPVADAIIAGQPVVVDAEQFNEIIHTFDNTEDVFAAAAAANRFEQQAGSTLGSLFGAVFGSMSVTGLTPDEIRQANNQFTYIGHKRRATGEVIDTIQLCVSVICRTFFNVDPFDLDFQTYISKLIQVIQYTDAVQDTPDDMITDKFLMAKIKEMNNEANLIAINPRMNTVPIFMQRRYATAHKKLTELSRLASARLRNANVRMEPLCIMLTGPPGVGKSAFVNTATQVEWAWTHDVDEPFDGTSVYSYKPDSEYWSGYANQKHVMMDDVFMAISEDIRAQESMAIIDMVNTAPYPLNMADIESKGVTFFNSEFLWLTTNLMNHGIARAKLNVGMSDQEAVIRRLHVVLHRTDVFTRDQRIEQLTWRVDKCPLPEYLNATLDSAQVMRMIQHCRRVQVEQHAQYTPTNVDLIAKFGPQALVWRILTPTEIYLKCVELKLFSWSEGPMFKYMVSVFGLIMAAIAVRPILSYLFPPMTTQSEHLKVKKIGRHSGKNDVDVSWREGKIGRRTGGNAGSNWDHHMRGNLNVQNGAMDFFSCINKTLRKSCVYLGAQLFDENGVEVDGFVCNGWHVRDSYIVTCAHWYKAFRDDPTAKLYITTCEGEFEAPVPSNVLCLNGIDVVIFELPKCIPRPPSCFKYLLDMDTAPVINNGTTMYLMAMKDSNMNIRRVMKAPHSAAVDYEAYGETFTIEQPIGYFDKTMKGDSGSIVVAEGPQGAPAIVGMHLGSVQQYLMRDVGVAIPVTKQHIVMMIDEMQRRATEQVVMIPQSLTTKKLCVTEHEYMIAPEANVGQFPLKVVREVSIDNANYGAKQSKIKRSLCFGWQGPPTYVPAVLHVVRTPEGVIRNPMYMALEKIRQIEFECEELSPDTQAYLQYLYPREPYFTFVLTLEQALNGVPDKNIPSIHTGTSAGYPFSKKATKGKAPFIVRTDVGLECSDDFRESCDYMWNCFETDMPCDVIFADTLKDETRSVEKVAQCKSRVISSCPIDFLVVVRRLFGGHVAYVQSTPTDKPVAVGINMHSLDKLLLKNRLNKCKGSVLSGDFSNYDGTIPIAPIVAYIDYVNWWYDDGPQMAKMRHRCASSIYNALHICGTKIYRAHGGNPSGEPLTSILNSFVNIIITHHILTTKYNMDITEFQMTCYGDDHVITTEQDGLKCSDLAPHYLSCFGMVYTHWSKEVSTELDTLDTVRYLGRSMAGLYEAPLELRVVLESVYWKHSEDNSDDLLLATIETLFIELSHFGKTIFDEYSGKLVNYVKGNKLTSHLTRAILENLKPHSYYHNRKYDPKMQGKGFVNHWTSERTFVPQSRQSWFDYKSAKSVVNDDPNFTVQTLVKHVTFTPNMDRVVGKLGGFGEYVSEEEVENPITDKVFTRDSVSAEPIGTTKFVDPPIYDWRDFYMNNPIDFSPGAPHARTWAQFCYKSLVDTQYVFRNPYVQAGVAVLSLIAATNALVASGYVVKHKTAKELSDMTTDTGNGHFMCYDDTGTYKCYYAPPAKSWFTPTSGVAKVHNETTADTRNEEFTERAANESNITQQGQMGAFHDVAPVTSTAVDETIIPIGSADFNMEYYEYNGALERTYQLADYTWLPSLGAGKFMTIDFPGALTAIPFIADRILDNDGMITGVEISFRNNTNKFLYGSFIAEFQPNRLLDLFPATSVYAASGSPHMIVSASSSDVAVMRIPFISPKRYLELNNYTAGEMGSVNLWLLNPLTNVQGGDVSGTIYISARFIETKLVLPHSNTGLSSSLMDGSFEVLKANSKKTIATGIRKSNPCVFTPNSGHMQKLPHKTTEAARKNAAHSISSRLVDTVPQNGLVTAANYVASYVDSFTAVAHAAGGAMALLGLSKPVTEDMGTIIKNNPFADFNYGKGISTTTKMSIDPDCAISTDPNVGGITVDEMAFNKLLGTPQLVNSIAFVNGTPASQLMVCGPFDNYGVFCDIVSQHFVYFRGSYKVKLYIVASLFHTVKLVVWLTDDGATNTTWENCYYKIIDVQGDTEVEFTVPYCDAHPAERTNAPDSFGLWCQVLAWSAPSATASAPVYVNIYKAAADDFRLSGQKAMQFTPNCDPRADFAKAFPTLHPSHKAYVCEKLVDGETITSLREILHRYHCYGSNTTPVNNAFIVPASTVVCQGLEMWSMCYRFYRGSIRMKLVTIDPRYIMPVVIQSSDGSALYEGSFASCPTNPQCEFEIPWYNNNYFESTTVSKVITTRGTGCPTCLFKSAGDDFSYHFLRAFPPGTWTLCGPTIGPAGFLNWATGNNPLCINMHAV